MPANQVTAIIVSWNVRNQLGRCLDALLKSEGLNLKVIVIDNASRDGSAEFVRKNYPGVDIIANNENRGFAAAVNQGLHRSNGDVVLINPDVLVEPDTIAILQQSTETHKDVGIVGPRIVYPGGQIQASIRRFPKTIDLLLTLTKIPNFLPQLVRTYAGLDYDYSQEHMVDQVMGSCFFIPRKTIELLGDFDEHYFIWFEEVDYCYRAQRAGLKTLYTPSTTVVHEKGASFAQQSILWKHKVLVQSMTHYAVTHLGIISATSVFITGWATAILAGLQQLFRIRKPAKVRNL